MLGADALLNMRVDDSFRQHFDGTLQQVFLYITDRCDLTCKHCLYKTTLASRDIGSRICCQLLRVFSSLGARKLTLIGGEPTLYGCKEGWRSLLEVIDEAARLGYEYVRLDTNGQFRGDLLQASTFTQLDDLAFSLDGHNAETNDGLRGPGTFSKCVKRIREAVALGYHVTVTTCVHTANQDRLEEMVELCTELGVQELNFHPLFIMGVDRDRFTGTVHISPDDWGKLYWGVRRRIDDGAYNVGVRVPQRFVSTSKYREHPEKYDYCPVRLGERVLVHPDRLIRICALCIGSRYHVATYDTDRIEWSPYNNELQKRRLARMPCMSQTRDFGDLVPLCISYKPYQNEFVWRNQRYDEMDFRDAPRNTSSS